MGTINTSQIGQKAGKAMAKNLQPYQKRYDDYKSAFFNLEKKVEDINKKEKEVNQIIRNSKNFENYYDKQSGKATASFYEEKIKYNNKIYQISTILEKKQELAIRSYKKIMEFRYFITELSYKYIVVDSGMKFYFVLNEDEFIKLFADKLEARHLDIEKQAKFNISNNTSSLRIDTGKFNQMKKENGDNKIKIKKYYQDMRRTIMKELVEEIGNKIKSNNNESLKPLSEKVLLGLANQKPNTSKNASPELQQTILDFFNKISFKTTNKVKYVSTAILKLMEENITYLSGARFAEIIMQAIYLENAGRQVKKDFFKRYIASGLTQDTMPFYQEGDVVAEINNTYENYEVKKVSSVKGKYEPSVNITTIFNGVKNICAALKQSKDKKDLAERLAKIFISKNTTGSNFEKSIYNGARKVGTNNIKKNINQLLRI